MLNDIEKILVSEEELDKKTTELAEAISKDFAGKELIVVLKTIPYQMYI